MFPEIPADLGAETRESLLALAADIKTAVTAALQEGKGAALEEATKYLAIRDDVLAYAQLAALSDDSDTGDDDVEGEDDDDDDEDTDASAESNSLAAARPVVTETGLSTEVEHVSDRIGPDAILSTERLGEDRPSGSAFRDWNEFASALVRKATDIRSNTSEKFDIGRIHGNFDAAHTLGNDAIDNMRKLGVLDLFGDRELTAACCAPVTPTYAIGCQNSTARPVKNSLANFRTGAERMAVSIYSSPTLDDVAGGAGIWTCEDDDDEGAEKTCATIECGTSTEFRMYGVYACLTIKNMLAMSFPELVAAYMNRLAALQARIGEVQMLDALGTAANAPISAPALGYGSTTSVTTSILNYLALRREQQRWDDQPMVAWAHRSVRTALQIDLSRRRREGGGSGIVPESAVDAAFADVGVNVTWSLDTASWMTAVPEVASGADPSAGTGGTLNQLPDSAEILIAPVGKFASLERGLIGMGVTGNNIYRDNASNTRNEFTFFIENFEGVVDTDGCPADLLVFDGLCHNGVQIADVAIDCDGTAAA